MNTQAASQIEKKLLHELEDSQKRIEVLKQGDPFNAGSGYASDNAASDTDVREQEDHQRIEAEIQSLEERIADIKIALDRVKKGRYGICKKCNKPIPQKRLDLIPETQYCVECESELKS